METWKLYDHDGFWPEYGCHYFLIIFAHPLHRKNTIWIAISPHTGHADLAHHGAYHYKAHHSHIRVCVLPTTCYGKTSGNPTTASMAGGGDTEDSIFISRCIWWFLGFYRVCTNAHIRVCSLRSPVPVHAVIHPLHWNPPFCPLKVWRRCQRRKHNRRHSDSDSDSDQVITLFPIRSLWFLRNSLRFIQIRINSLTFLFIFLILSEAKKYRFLPENTLPTSNLRESALITSRNRIKRRDRLRELFLN